MTGRNEQPRLRGVLAVALLFLAGLAVGDAHAGPPAPAAGSASPSISLRVSPIFGTDAGYGDGWMELLAYVDNSGAVAVRGTLEVESTSGGYGSSYGRFVARAPFIVLPRADVVLRVPLFDPALAMAITARADDGAKLAETSISMGATGGPLLVDIDEPSRLSVVMRGWPMTPSWRGPAYTAPGTAFPLTVGSPAIDATTGDPLLPDRTTGYASATVVVLPSERLARLQGAELDAVVGWVLAGGTVAVFPTRPEDLSTGNLTTLTGGPIKLAPAPAVMMTLPGAVRGGGATPGLMPPGLAPPSGPAPMPAPAAPSISDAGGVTPIGWFLPARSTPYGAGVAVGPSAALRAKVTGYTGGNLHPTEYGATAVYGLGQVHVLGFDPTSAPALSDPWAHGRVVNMLSDAWDRHALIALPSGGGQRSINLSEIHRSLDPNENFRPALGIAAILLVLYAIGVGPLTFMRAHKRGRPLDTLVWAPLASVACFAMIVVVGLAGKGWSGRARHIALVEAGAGMSRGSVRRFRGFFASQTRALRVRASEPGSVLEVVGADSRSQDSTVLKLDSDGATLEDLTSLPWQTVVVSEDGFAELGGGIALREKPDGSVVLANHTGRELRNVIVWAPKKEATFLAKVAAGDVFLSSAGRTLFSAATRRSESSGTRTVHPLDIAPLTSVLGHSADDVVTAWSAMSTASGSATDWWPDDVPVVIGEMVGGEDPGMKSDAGLRVESNVLLFRVLGEGGAT